MSDAPLVLSLFPGIGLLDMAFEDEGFCVVRGPDLLWGGDVRRFHPPAGKFDGVIGGPPCQAHSTLAHLVRATGKQPGQDMIGDFERVVYEASPAWFVMENVAPAPIPLVPGYHRDAMLLNNRWLGEEQNRLRRFTFGSREPMCSPWLSVDVAPLESVGWSGAILASGGRRPGLERRRGKTRGAWHGWTGGASYAHALQAQGLPPDFLLGDDSPFTSKGRFRMVGNGVPLPMGRAIARAVKRALPPQERARGDTP